MHLGLIAFRAVHFWSLAVLFGGGGLLLATGAAETAAFRLSLRLAALGNALGAAGWLALTLADVTGDPLSPISGQAWNDFLASPFGVPWAVQMGLALALLIPVLFGRAAPAALLGGAGAASQAWLGHAAAGTGFTAVVMIASYAMHVLAALAWVGALTMLCAGLGWWPCVGAALRVFSRNGPLTVAAILASGCVNAALHLDSIDQLTSTPYGRVVLCKAALFAAMLGLAAANRRQRDQERPNRALVLAIATETILGVAALWAAAVLGITAPAL